MDGGKILRVSEPAIPRQLCGPLLRKLPDGHACQPMGPSLGQIDPRGRLISSTVNETLPVDAGRAGFGGKAVCAGNIVALEEGANPRRRRQCGSGE